MNYPSRHQVSKESFTSPTSKHLSTQPHTPFFANNNSPNSLCGGYQPESSNVMQQLLKMEAETQKQEQLVESLAKLQNRKKEMFIDLSLKKNRVEKVFMETKEKLKNIFLEIELGLSRSYKRSKNRATKRMHTLFDKSRYQSELPVVIEIEDQEESHQVSLNALKDKEGVLMDIMKGFDDSVMQARNEVDRIMNECPRISDYPCFVEPPIMVIEKQLWVAESPVPAPVPAPVPEVQKQTSQVRQNPVHEVESTHAHSTVNQQSLDFAWSPTYKAKQVRLHDKTATKSGSSLYFDSISLAQPLLSSTQSTIWGIKVLSFLSNETICVGVGQRGIIDAKKYSLTDYNKLGHGCFMLCSNGATYSSSKRADNHILKSKGYKKGDTIWMRLNHHKQQLQFVVCNPNGTPSPMVKLPIQNTKQSNDNHIAVCLQEKGSSVELLNGKQCPKSIKWDK